MANSKNAIGNAMARRRAAPEKYMISPQMVPSIEIRARKSSAPRLPRKSNPTETKTTTIPHGEGRRTTWRSLSRRSQIK